MFIARYRDHLGNHPTRKFNARHLTHATRKAISVARSNNWTLLSVGKA